MELLVPNMRLFPYMIAGLELIAAVVYFYYTEWRVGLVWLLVGAANFAFAGIK